MDFRIGIFVVCTDGACGTLSQLVIDPASRKVTHLVVDPPEGHALARLVPVQLVAEADATIRLTCTRGRWRTLEFVEETRFLSNGRIPDRLALLWPYDEPISSALPLIVDHIPPGEVEVHRGEHLHAIDGTAGRVVGVVVDPGDHRVTQVLAREGHLWERKEVAVPFGPHDHFSADGVHVALSKRDVAHLPPVATRGLPGGGAQEVR